MRQAVSADDCGGLQQEVCFCFWVGRAALERLPAPLGADEESHWPNLDGDIPLSRDTDLNVSGLMNLPKVSLL